jgi:hypothetical protein
MKTRVELLNSLLNFDRPLSEIWQPLNSFSWDSARGLVILKKQQIVNILRRYLDGQLSRSDVENWANAIEGREDIEYESDFEEMLDEVIFELANPLLSRPLSPDSAREWLNQLEGSASVNI